MYYCIENIAEGETTTDTSSFNNFSVLSFFATGHYCLSILRIKYLGFIFTVYNYQQTRFKDLIIEKQGRHSEADIDQIKRICKGL